MKTIMLGVVTVVLAMVAGPTWAAAGKGMTWGKYSHDVTTGTDLVGCGGVCNPYVGDTQCRTLLPILCVRIDGSPNPGVAADFYHGWREGHITTTMPLAGTALTSQAVADQICAATFGTGWVMAEHHHPTGGGGWSWYAFGNIRQDTRFWTRIQNQPGNCWDP
ncbi:hypothetical protein [Tahibacter amnicola]|uniref:Flagellar hook-length control protein n=1 Tax=Tahibacter amnicola TaxID=2976241 RepID=A0ABY6BJM0_9GAMM|nr:hypothetical protein [Tahibacter amnicola]UXI70218.1 hypothetical protein N4264_11465 [Tahibacter amnicola]